MFPTKPLDWDKDPSLYFVNSFIAKWLLNLQFQISAFSREIGLPMIPRISSHYLPTVLARL
jgi:hypothetical protein